MTLCNFADGPRFVRSPQSVQAEIDTPVSLICQVDGNPTPEISWIHENYDKKVRWRYVGVGNLITPVVPTILHNLCTIVVNFEKSYADCEPFE